jgi:plastocyanin
MQSNLAVPVYSGSGSHLAAIAHRLREQIGDRTMTIREDIGAQNGGGTPRLVEMRLTRRAVSAGMVAVGAAVLTRAAGLVVADAAAAPIAMDVRQTGGTQPACPDPAGAQPAANAETGGNQVVIANFAFAPDTLTVPVGTEVTWVNQDDVPHTVTSDDRTTFASDLLDTDDTFSHTFDAPGTFGYFCSVHPMMTATVVVQA